MPSHILSIFVFGVASNIDCFAVGLSYGMKQLRLHGSGVLLVGLISFTGTALSMLLGGRFALFFPAGLANFAGGLTIALIGVVGLLRFFLPRNAETPPQQPRGLTFRETVPVGVALAVNNAGLGIGASVTGLRAVPTALCVLVLCMLFLSLGNAAGRKNAALAAGSWPEPLADLLMIALGLYEILI